jgi:plasmid stabilization system protein ParE
LGIQFEAELQKMLESIAQMPLMYPREFGPVRRALLLRFNQVLFYTVDAGAVTIHELRNARRKPPNWRARGFRDN